MKYIPIFIFILLLYAPSIYAASTSDYLNSGERAYDARNYPEAIQNYEKAAELFKQSREKGGYANVLNIIGMVYKAWGRYDLAMENFRKALEINEELGKNLNLAMIADNIGMTYYAWGQYDKALEYYGKALTTFEKLGKKTGIGSVLNNIGQVHNARGNYDQAVESYRKALAIYEELGDKSMIAVSLYNIAQVYYEWGQYDRAIEYLRKNLATAEELGNKNNIGSSLSGIGMVYGAWGQYEKALEYHRKGLAIDEELGKKDHLAISLSNIGEAFRQLGQYEKALENYRKSLKLSEELGSKADIATVLNNIGLVYTAWGHYDRAVESYRKALEISEELGEKGLKATILNNIGAVYNSWGQYEKAIDHYQQALEIDRRLEKEASIALCLNNIGVVYGSLGQNDKAIEYLRDSIRIKEKLRKTATGDIRRDYLASQIYTYQILASIYLKANDPAGVLHSIEQSRAKLLSERIAGIDSDLSLPALDEVQKGLGSDEAVLIFSNIDRDDFILMVITASDVSIKEISKDSYLAKTESLYKESILLMLENQRGKEDPLLSKNTEQESEFERSINYYRTSLVQSATNGQYNVKQATKNKKSPTHTQEFSQALYELLFKPAENAFEDKKSLIIVPDGILGFLPFETLVDEQNQYIAERYDIKYAHSMTILSLLNKRHYKANRKPMLAFGGAVYDDTSYNKAILKVSTQLYLKKEISRSLEENRSFRGIYEMLDRAKWSNLPGTMSEVRNISQGVNGAEIVTGDEVTEDKVKHLSEDGKLAGYKILHFATHGLVVPIHPELSAIVLSQFKKEKNGEDGYLRMGEIAKLNIKADFVNLSACETGLGKIYGGEGVIGLTQSFLIAGANGLSVSLWAVADESTAKFMTELYRKIEETGMDYSHAISEAKRDFIKGKYGNLWQHPYFWSPFVYYGK